jgi:hypothetical protein
MSFQQITIFVERIRNETGEFADAGRGTQILMS